MSSGGFEDMEGLVDDDGNIIKDHGEDEAEEEASAESTTESPSDAGSQETTPVEEELSEDTIDEPEPEVTEEPQVERSQQEVRAEAVPDASLVKELATQPIPGTTDPDARYPYAMRRSDWEDEREGNKKFVLREEIEEMEERVEAELSGELFPHANLTKTDVREAAFLVGLRNLDGVVDVLNQWGFAELEELRK